MKRIVNVIKKTNYNGYQVRHYAWDKVRIDKKTLDCEKQKNPQSEIVKNIEAIKKNSHGHPLFGKTNNEDNTIEIPGNLTSKPYTKDKKTSHPLPNHPKEHIVKHNESINKERYPSKFFTKEKNYAETGSPEEEVIDKALK